MKFNNGCWMLKEGIGCFAPKEVYFFDIQPQKVSVLAPTIDIVHRGATLGGVNLKLEITSPMPEVIRVQTLHHAGVQKKAPAFELSDLTNQDLDVTEDEQKICITSGSLSLILTKKPFSMTFERNGEVIAVSSGMDLAYMKEDWKGHYYDKGTGAYMRQQLSMSVGECVYGLGERFTPFVKNGQSVDMWNEDGGTSTELSYKNIPFYVTSSGYGVFVNHPEKVSFEVGTSQVSKVGFSVPGESLDYFLINGPTMKEVLMRYTDITGKPALPPQWTFGLWLSTSFTTNYDEATVMSFIDGMKERNLPLQVFHFDCFWMKDFHWSDFVWDERVFPDPVGMLARIRARGLKVCVWINSYIAQESVLFAEGMEKGYFVKRTNGDVWQWDMWQPGMALVDFTNPAACKWFQDKLEVLLDMGVDCFKTDFGERIPTEDVKYFDGSDPVKMHNYYTYLYNKTVYELLQRKKGHDQAVLFARSATAGGQKFPVHWGGDCWSTYNAMAESLRGGLSLTMSGFGYWSHDIGGFENTSTPDVYKRWAAFGLLSSHSRLHGSNSYRVPWNYDEEACDVVRFFTNLKLSLLPYIYSTAVNTSRTGVPVMRSMIMEFEKDMTCRYLDKQYMLGDSLLVAPIFNDQSRACYYLPKGRWTNYLTGEVSEGGIWCDEHHSYLSIPLWVRENSIIPAAKNMSNAADDYRTKLQMKVYTLCGEASGSVYADGQKIMALTVKEENDTVVCQAQADNAYEIRFVNRRFEAVSGADFVIDGRDTVIMVNDPQVVVVCK